MNRRNYDEDSFAYKHLQDKGWNEGQGLGRDNSGEYDPVKVHLRHGTGGLGHDSSKEFTNQWWDHVFNKTAAKINVATSESGVNVTLDKELSTEKKEQLKRKVLYGNFVKGTTLDQGKETHEQSSSDDSSEDEKITKPAAITILTDEELLRACGGRTAHKGARHGFKMNGKLARLEAMDSQTSSPVPDNSANQSDTSSESDTPSLLVKQNKKEKKRKKSTEDSPDIESMQKKKKKKSKHREDLQEEPEEEAEERTKVKKKKNKYKTHCDDNEVDTINSDTEDNSSKKKKKSKKSKKPADIDPCDEDIVEDNFDSGESKKKKKKKKK